jgi:hypothetical protein
MPFEEGVSGNPGGRPKRAKLTYDAMLVELKSRESSKDPKGIRKIVQTVVDLAEGGEKWAVEFVRDTTDGKPAQAIVGGDEDDSPISLVTRIRLLGPDD